jgi:hypothetical protein
MKNIVATLFIAVLLVSGLRAQDVNAQLNEAQSAYKSGELQNTRFALQQALNEIDRAIGAEIIKMLPENMGSMAFVEAEDNITATSSGFAGLFVSRSYKTDDETNASVQIMSDAPFLAGVNALLSLPSFVSDPNQKRIRIGSYRALLQKSQDDSGKVSWDVQIPVSSTLITFHCSGVDSEKEVTDMANTIPVEQIARFAQ